VTGSDTGRTAFHHDMAVNPAEPHRGDAGCQPLAPPRLRLVEHSQCGVRLAKEGVRCVAARGRRKGPVIHGENGLDQCRRASGRLGVPDVCLHGAEHSGTGRIAPDLGQRFQLDPIADSSSGAMPLDQADLFWLHSGRLVRAPQRQRLSARVRPGQAPGPVRGRCPAGQPRVDTKSAPLCLVGAHEGDDSASLPRKEARRLLVIHAHLTVGERAEAGKADHLKRVQRQVDATGEGEVELAGEQRVGRGDDGQQARRAGAIYCVAGTVKVKVIADPSSDGVAQCPCQ